MLQKFYFCLNKEIIYKYVLIWFLLYLSIYLICFNDVIMRYF